VDTTPFFATSSALCFGLMLAWLLLVGRSDEDSPADG
jgi:hypothetical protein